MTKRIAILVTAMAMCMGLGEQGDDGCPGAAPGREDAKRRQNERR